MEAQSAWQTPDAESQDYLCNEKVTLVKRRGCIVGLSSVYDYVFRPLKLENMCLYDWVRLCTREKVRKSAKQANDQVESEDDESDSDEYAVESDSDSDSFTNDNEVRDVDNTRHRGLFDFVKKHPLYGSHQLRCVGEENAYIPNFIGATLPRRDRGDREWYCLTMLALFCPWRSGLQLKEHSQSWDDAFVNHKFTERQLAVMDHFNLRYECMDARDDFHSQGCCFP